ncbi:hypothetical protein CcCBS67573_g09291 [Chytriomyces confervae]|uniref:Uncharacterized protein n=1 Tax=Chytriomyces confervae TaxID=246404 RepID=A0A507DZ00_9FUNG|nr:hypothetical protein CcCBS67573_g09291 [Chytriomyces confervae]
MTSKGLRVKGQRYGEIRAARANGFAKVSVSVFSTFGLNECPHHQWATITEAAVIKQLGCRTAVINGPRLWMVDYFGPSMIPGTETPVAFDGLEMRSIATINLSLMQAMTLRGNYTARPMPRMVEFVWEAGSQAHFLITPKGLLFILQSISQKHLPALNVDNVQEILGAANAFKEIPKGWKFETRLLQNEVVVKTDASVGHFLGLQDEFDNTYVLVGDVASFAGL